MKRLTKSTVLAITTSGISLVAGIYTGYAVTKKRITDTYEGVIEEQVAKAKAFYSQRNKTGEFADPVALAERLVEETEEVEDGEDVVDSDIPIVADPGELFDQQIDPEDRVNYNRMSENYTGPAVERETYIQDPGPPIDGESMADYERRLAKAAHDRVQEVIDRVGGQEVEEEVVVSNIFETNSVDPLVVNDSVREPGRPYIITSVEFMENELEHTQTTITYYLGDEVLADERDKPLSNVNGVVGQKNLQFGNGSGDANIVYIRNEEMEVDFEVCLSDGTYKEEVLGVAPPTKRQR